MVLFISGFATETNTFSPLPTGAASFYNESFRRRDASRDETAPWTAAQRVWRARAEADGLGVVESLNAFAQPAGLTVRAVYEELRDTLVADLRAAMPVDAVCLTLHGAMAADGYDDCEGDLIRNVRSVVGPDVPIGVELDLHCHLTPTMVDNATVIVTYKEYPHTDIAERAAEIYDLVMRVRRGEVRPVTALHDTRMIGIWRTSSPAMRRFVERMQALEGRDGVLSISFGHGFPWADVEAVGAKMLVIADGDADKAATLARRLSAEIWEMRGETATTYLTPDAAIDRALAAPAGPVVIADVADNAGGGAPSDSAFVLRRLVERRVQDAALGYIWDPVAVALCREAGEGARLDLRLCGKLGPASGTPLDLTVEVRRLDADHAQTGLGGTPSPLGESAWVRTGGIDLVLTSLRSQPFYADGFTGLGVALENKKIIVVKSMQHFMAGFGSLAAQVLYVTTPGAIPPELDRLPYTKRTTPFWPQVENPFDR